MDVLDACSIWIQLRYGGADYVPGMLQVQAGRTESGRLRLPHASVGTYRAPRCLGGSAFDYQNHMTTPDFFQCLYPMNAASVYAA